MKRVKYTSLILVSMAALSACSDDYLENDPTQYVSEQDVNKTMQENPSNVQAYVTGAYYNLYGGGDTYSTSHDDFGLPAIKLATDLLCEDIAFTRNASWFSYDYQRDNRMGNYRRTRNTWSQLYNVIDNCNTIIGMLKPEDESAAISDQAQVMLGEAYSMRAYSYFWLINLFQQPYNVSTTAPGIPLKTESEYRMERVPVGEIYTQILSDIKSGYAYLKDKGFHPDNNSLSEFAAAAIYSNILMYTGDYSEAAKYAQIAAESRPLNSNNEMLSGFNSVSMSEVIWGYNVTNETTGYYASFFSHVDPYTFGYAGIGYRKSISSYLYDQIAKDDVRKNWFGLNAKYAAVEENSYEYEQTYSNGATSYDLTPFIQNKYVDTYITSGGTADPFTSAIIYFRSGEMYFVAAEAYLLAGNTAKATEMLETVMKTRIPGYAAGNAGRGLKEEIEIQKRIETWMEGSRFLDARRRGETLVRSNSYNHNSSVSADYSAIGDLMIYKIPDAETENNGFISDADNNK